MTLARPTALMARLLLVAALLTYARWLVPQVTPVAGGSDSSGYLWSAQRFALGHVDEPIRRLDGLPAQLNPDVFSPLGTTVAPDNTRLVAFYPSGLPALLAATWWVWPGENGTRALLVIIALTTVWLTYRLGRASGLERRWAATAASLLGLSPLFLFIAVQPLSDVLSTMCAAAVMVSAWRARRMAAGATWAGALVGLATLVRPTNIVLLLPVVVCVPLVRDRLWRLVAGGVPFAAFLLVYQRAAYGSPWRVGYGNMSSAFSVTHVWPTLLHYGTWLPSLFTMLIVMTPLALWAWSDSFARWRWIAVAWIGSIGGLYAFYYHTAETWWYLRFILPACPIIVVAAMRGWQHVVNRTSSKVWVGRRLVATLAWGLVTWHVTTTLLTHELAAAYVESPAYERQYRDAVRWMSLRAAPTTPVLMVQLGGAAAVYAPTIPSLRFDRLSDADWRALREWQQRSGRSIRAALFPFEEAEVVAAGGRLGCTWQLRDAYRQVRIWECPP